MTISQVSDIQLSVSVVNLPLQVRTVFLFVFGATQGAFVVFFSFCVDQQVIRFHTHNKLTSHYREHLPSTLFGEKQFRSYLSKHFDSFRYISIKVLLANCSVTRKSFENYVLTGTGIYFDQGKCMDDVVHGRTNLIMHFRYRGNSKR